MFNISFTGKDAVRVAWTFVFTFVSVFLATAQGWGSMPDLATAKAAAVSAGAAALAAAFSALKNLVLADGSTVKG